MGESDRMRRISRRCHFLLFCCLRRVVVVALLGLLGGRGEVGRVGRHGELFLDAGDARGNSDSAGFSFDWEDIPSLSFSSVLLSSSRGRGSEFDKCES